MLLAVPQSSTSPTYHLTVRGERGRFLDVELAIDDGLLAVELVLTRDAVEQLRKQLSATVSEGPSPVRAVPEDTREDDEEIEGEALFASRRTTR